MGASQRQLIAATTVHLLMHSSPTEPRLARPAGTTCLYLPMTYHGCERSGIEEGG